MKYRIAMALSLAVTSLLGAQSGGPYAPLVLLEPASARMLGMGNVGVAGRDDDVLFYNPAQLAVARGMSVSAERYSANAGGGTVSAVTRLWDGGIAIGAQTVDYRAPILGIASAPGDPRIVLLPFPLDRGTSRGGGDAIGSSAAISVGYGATIKGFRVGGAAKYVVDQLAASRITGTSFDVGVSKDWMRYFTAALAVQNIGAAADVPCIGRLGQVANHTPCEVSADPTAQSTGPVWFDLPLRTTIGVSFARDVGPFDLASTAGASMYRASWISPAAGAELGYSWLDGYDIALRAGLRRSLAGESAVTAGAGFTMDRLSIDYALETFAGGRVGHRIGLRIR